LVFEINPNDQARISVLPIISAGQPINLQGATWNTVIEYLSMLDNRLPALQSVTTGTVEAIEKRFAGVDDELGAVVAGRGD
jgi:hypothetical protein